VGTNAQGIPRNFGVNPIVHNFLSIFLQGGRAERIEYLLLHEFHKLKYVLPDKALTKGQLARAAGNFRGNGSKAKPRSQQRKPKYGGGLVLEPKKGLYDKYILLLDFNSLYPSIIQEFNLCFTTVQRPRSATLAIADVDDVEEDAGSIVAVDGEGVAGVPALPTQTAGSSEGVLPRLIRTLVEKRRAVTVLLQGLSQHVIYLFENYSHMFCLACS
jgi:DNA polymerase alpha subunit A